MQDVMFQRWLSTNESQKLVVGGMELSTNTVATSPLTFPVALLTQALEGLPGAVWITFFCGIHATPGGGLEGAQGIMRSFIFQPAAELKFQLCIYRGRLPEADFRL